MPADKSLGMVFCEECIVAARAALENHEVCVSMIVDPSLKPDIAETLISWPLLELPFVPFTVLFCHVIGTSSANDLRYLEGLVGSLETASSKQSIYPICAKQFRIFEALCNVAREYIQSASSLHEGNMQGPAEFNLFVELFGIPANNSSSHSMGAFGLNPSSMEAAEAESYGQYWGDSGSREALQEVRSGGSRTKLDVEGAKLGDWFQKNHDTMRNMELNF